MIFSCKNGEIWIDPSQWALTHSALHCWSKISLSLVKFLCLPDLFENLMASPTNWPPRERLSSRQCLPIPTTKDFIKLHLRWNLYDISFPWFDGQLIYFHSSQRYTPAPIRYFLPIFRLYNPEYNQIYNFALYLIKSYIIQCITLFLYFQII